MFTCKYSFHSISSTAVTRLRVCKPKRCTFKLSEPSCLTWLTNTHTSTVRVWKAYNVSGNAQSKMMNQQDTRTWISLVFEKSRVFFSLPLFPPAEFCERFNFLSRLLQDSGYFFLCLPFKFWPARSDPHTDAGRCVGITKLVIQTYLQSSRLSQNSHT